MRWRLAVLSVAVPTLACGGGEETPEQAVERLREARADSVAMAEAAYDAAAFDTISWPSVEERLNRGSVVWQFSCAKCHGPNGVGTGELAQQWDLAMPDLTIPEWEYAADLEAIRHRIFVGHESEMPNWGLHGLKARDIDAVTAFIIRRLRGEPLPEQ